MINILVDKIVQKLTSFPASVIISVMTAIVVLISVPLVYFIVILFCIEYTSFFFVLSIITPLLIAPGILFFMIKLSKHLLYFKEALEKEIQKNKQQDLVLFEKARFVLMGEMMANISHQWKQPLNTVGLAIVSLRTSNKIDDSMNKYFDIMEDNVSYLAATIDDFMSFFDKKAHSEMRDLDAIVKEIKSIIYTHISNKDIELKITLDKSYGNIEIASSISQVILNLLNNAKDAAAATTKHKEIKLHFTSNKYGLEIECCDNGQGIDDTIKDKIFDPYFTTKERKQGNGIGLYMSKEIVHKVFDGKIDLNSRKCSQSSISPIDEGEKTCFYIAIPYSENCILQKEHK